MATVAHHHVARARSCHSLVVAGRRGVGGDTVRDRIAGSARAGGVWERSGTAADTEAEATRPLAATGPGLRAGLVHHDDGTTDLVLVARRSTHTLADLRAVAALLLDGEAAAPEETPGDAGPLPAAPAPDWGMPEPGAGGTAAPYAFTLPASRPPGAVPPETLLLTAVSTVLGRYSAGEDRAVGVIEGRQMTVHSPAATVAVLRGEHRAGEQHRPFLAAPLPVLIHWTPHPDGSATADLYYDPAAVAPPVARDFADRVAHVAGELAARPQQPLGDIALLTDGEARALVAAGRTPAPARPPLPGRSIHGAFRDVARARPTAVAVTDGDTCLTYAELLGRAERVAANLRELGVAPGDMVGVALERTCDLVVVLLGVLEAGCAYVPLDLRYPADRLRYTVADSGAVLIVGSDVPEVPGVRVVEPRALERPAEPGGIGDGSDSAYVIYTSGSTGRPKGVVVPHRNVTALIDATREDFGLSGSDVWTFFHSSAFDFSVWEIWGCLLTGGRLVVVPYWVTRDTDLFYRLLADERVTVLSQTPSAFAQVAEVDTRLRRDLAVRLVVFGGEPLDVAILRPWFARHSPARCRISNMFGITETTVHVTEQTVTPADVACRSRSVGRALPGWSVSVRDPRGRMLPPGASGEIYVGGAGVATGYLNRPELTAQRFVDDPYGEGRVYRSGDRGRLRPDGRLDHLGRLDNQVKIRGHRIELDEIRNVLLNHPAVTGAAVVLRYDDPADPATARIDAYVSVTGGDVPAADLTGHARGRLPDYMMPATLTGVPAIPLTLNGKVDTAALPEPGRRPATPVRTLGADTAPLADRILAMWSRVLNTPVRLEDNFFELGGNSLLVIRLLREMRDSGLPGVSTQDFYRNSVADQFIQHISGTPG